ncbi:site-specific DNA-methyltransferase [Acinetobacter baumannii]|nr:site-specific DNA-methyltransferase [Acinetobacter baumannii]
MISDKTLRQLNSIDWDFIEPLHGTSKILHWYPGTFPSELPCSLIQGLSNFDDLVFDPYAGVGTTGLEALRLGRKVWLVENNPIGCLASYVAGGLLLIKNYDPNLITAIFKKINYLLQRVFSESSSELDFPIDYSLLNNIDNILDKLVNPSPSVFLNSLLKNHPKLENLKPWIENKSLVKITLIINQLYLNNELGNFDRLIIITMLSAVLKSCSSQTQSWGHIADRVLPKEMVEKDVLLNCLKWLNKTEKNIKNTDIISDKKFDECRLWVSQFNWGNDISSLETPPFPVDLLLTSPPYADAIDYTFAQRLSLYLIGYDDLKIKNISNVEIGARRKRAKSTSTINWANELSGALNIQKCFLSDKGLLSFVLPHKDAGRNIGVEAITNNLEADNYELIFEVDRAIRQLKTRQSWTSIKKEIVQIYGKKV